MVKVVTAFDSSQIKLSTVFEDQYGLGLAPKQRTISEEVIKLKDQGVRDALQELGWRPPQAVDDGERDRSEAWYAVTKLLKEVKPRYLLAATGNSGLEKTLNRIKELHAAEAKLQRLEESLRDVLNPRD